MEATARQGKPLLLAVTWAVALYVAATVLPQLRGLIPGDAPSFYFAARMAAEGDLERLYDPAAIAQSWDRLEAEGVYREAAKHDNYFLRPAFSAYLYAPLGLLSFGAAWRLFSVLCICGALAVAWKFPIWFGRLKDNRLWAPWLVAYFPFVWSVGEGQDTILLTLCLGAAIHMVLSGREVSGGMAAALLIVKPHLAWGVPVALLAAGYGRAVAAFALTALALLGASIALVGAPGVRQWMTLLASPETDIAPETMFNVRALALEAGSAPALALTVVLLVSFLCVAWRGDLSDKLACGVLAPLLFSPHTYPQDLALVAILPFVTSSADVKWAVLAPWLYLFPPGQGGNWVFLALSTAFAMSLGFKAFRSGARPRERELWRTFRAATE